MFKNFLTIAFRNLSRNKGFTITNLLGLSIGMTSTILILLWVKDELGYDKFHKNYQSVYKLFANRDFNNQVFTDPNMAFPLAKAVAAELPEVRQAAVITYPQELVITAGEKKIKKTGYAVNDAFFNIFSWKFLRGSAASAFPGPASVVITKSTAKAFFGDADPLNKILKIDNRQEAKVTAVLDDVPGNSTLQFDFVMPFDYNDPEVKASMNEWYNSSWSVYIDVAPGTNMQLLDKKITDLKHRYSPNDKKISTYFSFPLSKLRLYGDFKDGKNTGGMIEYVRLFAVIGVIILLIACVNFMNLSTARSEKRAREVGIRKSLGSPRMQLLLQFLSETMVLSFLSFLISLLCVYLLLPSFNLLVQKKLSLPVTEPYCWITAAVIILFTGFVAGSYPALYLSSFNPVKVLKGTFTTGKNILLPRHVLVVAQFVISILLISATIIIYQQLQHIRNRELGYNPANLIMVPATDDTHKNYTVIKDELLKTGFVSSVTRTSSPITEVWWKTPAPDWEGKPANMNLIFSGLNTDADFTKTMGIKMLQGKDFSGMPADSAYLLLNKAAVDASGIKDPVGKQMRNGPNTYTVIGVTDNVVMESPYQPVEPMMILFSPYGNNVNTIRLNKNAPVRDALQAVENIFKKYNPAYPFEYKFTDREFEKKFVAEDLIGRLTNIFAGLAIFICCIGLAGLTSFTIEKRFREIGIRKVLGATVTQVISLVAQQFLRLVLVAFIIAAPLAWWGMNSWLNKYTYHITISFWLFPLVGVVVLLLALAIVSLNTIRAATASPVKSLRTE